MERILGLPDLRRRCAWIRAEEANQLSVEDLGCFQMRVVADVGDENQFGVGERLRCLPGMLGEVRPIFRAADDQRLRLHLRPVVYHGIQGTSIAGHGPDQGQPGPLTAQGHPVADADMFEKLRFPLHDVTLLLLEDRLIDLLGVR